MVKSNVSFWYSRNFLKKSINSLSLVGSDLLSWKESHLNLLFKLVFNLTSWLVHFLLSTFWKKYGPSMEEGDVILPLSSRSIPVLRSLLRLGWKAKGLASSLMRREQDRNCSFIRKQPTPCLKLPISPFWILFAVVKAMVRYLKVWTWG